MTKETITILLADDQPFFKLGVRNALRNIKHIRIAAEASTGKELVELTAEWKPDVILTEIALPEMDGIIATGIITHDYPEIKMIALSKFKDESHILDMLNAGAKGYLLKSINRQELVTAIEQVVKGTPYFSQEISERITNLLTKNPGFINQHFTVLNFSLREHEIIRLICEGKTSKEMASLLHISKRTVESHRRRIMDKIGVSSTAEIITYALSRGLYTVRSDH